MVSLFTTESIRVAHRDDHEGVLVCSPEGLVALLVHLSPIHGRDAGRWYLEAGFGPLAERRHDETFTSLEEAVGWVAVEVQSRERYKSYITLPASRQGT